MDNHTYSCAAFLSVERGKPLKKSATTSPGAISDVKPGTELAGGEFHSFGTAIVFSAQVILLCKLVSSAAL